MFLFYVQEVLLSVHHNGSAAVATCLEPGKHNTTTTHIWAVRQPYVTVPVAPISVSGVLMNDFVG